MTPSHQSSSIRLPATDRGPEDSGDQAVRYEIVGRTGGPGAALANPERDFVRSQGNPTDVDAVFSNPDISLYALSKDRRHVYFVEVPERDRRALELEPFLYRGQFKFAGRLIRVPMATCLEVADRMEAPRCIFLFSTGRCGSTLLSNLFGGVPGVLSISEPDVFSQIYRIAVTQRIPRDEANRLYEMSCRLLMPVQARAADHVVLKFRSEVSLDASGLVNAVPDSRPFFNYRSAADVVASFNRVWGDPYGAQRRLYRHPVIGPIYRGWRSFVHLKKPSGIYPGFPHVAVPRSASVLARYGYIGRFSLEWFSKVRSFLDLRAVRPDTFAIRYEDLVAEPSRTAAILLRKLSMSSDDTDAALRTLEHDAHEGTPLARASSSRWDLEDAERELVREIVEDLGGIRGLAERVPGTLTPSGD